VIVCLGEGVNEHPDLDHCLDPDHHVLVTPHGTGAAGVLCGDGTVGDRVDPVSRVRGLAPWIRLFANDGLCLDAACVQWFDHHDIQISSHQRAAVNDDSSVNPIDEAEEHGASPGQDLLFVQAVGNDGDDGNGSATVDFLDEGPRVLGVAASNAQGTEVADFSSRGDEDDPSTWSNITAPGCMYAVRLHPAEWVAGAGFPALGLGIEPCPEVDAVEGAAYRALGYPCSGAPARPRHTSPASPRYCSRCPPTSQHSTPNACSPAPPTPSSQPPTSTGTAGSPPAKFRQDHRYKAGYGLVNATAAAAAAHCMSLHPTADPKTAVDCYDTGRTLDGSLVLNPDGGTC